MVHTLSASQPRADGRASRRPRGHGLGAARGASATSAIASRVVGGARAGEERPRRKAGRKSPKDGLIDSSTSPHGPSLSEGECRAGAATARHFVPARSARHKHEPPGRKPDTKNPERNHGNHTDRFVHPCDCRSLLGLRLERGGAEAAGGNVRRRASRLRSIRRTPTSRSSTLPICRRKSRTSGFRCRSGPRGRPTRRPTKAPSTPENHGPPKHERLSGPKALVVRDTVYLDGVLLEDTERLVRARRRRKRLWYLGEETTEYVDGVGSMHGSWEAGKDGALPGVAHARQPRRWPRVSTGILTRAKPRTTRSCASSAWT
jgi:hypothetical protein